MSRALGYLKTAFGALLGTFLMCVSAFGGPPPPPPPPPEVSIPLSLKVGAAVGVFIVVVIIILAVHAFRMKKSEKQAHTG